jgi:hypothetical protein
VADYDYDCKEAPPQSQLVVRARLGRSSQNWDSQQQEAQRALYFFRSLLRVMRRSGERKLRAGRGRFQRAHHPQPEHAYHPDAQVLATIAGPRAGSYFAGLSQCPGFFLVAFFGWSCYEHFDTNTSLEFSCPLPLESRWGVSSPRFSGH